MRFPAHLFTVAFIDQPDNYLDVELIDTSTKGELRCWRITKDLETNEWWGTLRRSGTIEDAFEDGVYLPKRIVQSLVKVFRNHLDKEARNV